MPHAADNMTLCMPFAARETSSLRIVPSSPSLITKTHHHMYIISPAATYSKKTTASYWHSYPIKKRKVTKKKQALHPVDPFQCYPCSNCAYMSAWCCTHALPCMNVAASRELCCMELLVTMCLKIENKLGMCATLLLMLLD